MIVPVSQRVAFRLILGFVCLFAFSAQSTHAQAPPRPHSIHVEVLVQSPDGRPIGYLGQKNFIASLGNQDLPVALTRPVLGSKAPQGPYVPTRMLIIFPPSAASSADLFPATLSALQPLWARQWKVAAARSDGTATEYANSGAQLEKLWMAPSASGLTAQQAIRNLKSFRGRRVVLYAAGPPKEAVPAPKWLADRAAETMAQILVVDGGVPGLPVSRSDVWLSPGPDEPANRGPAADQRVEPSIVPNGTDSDKNRPRVRAYQSGEFHETNVHRAIQDAMHLALGYYELRIRPPSTIPPDSTLLITINGPQKMQVTAQVYGQGNLPQLKIVRK